jgi:peptidoglycan hydrolase-like protein with peptidoglycan-binding domain
MLKLVALFTALVLSASGCATLGRPTTKVEHYPKCYEPLAKLRQADKSIAVATVGGAVAGALAGGILGAMLGGKRGAVAGAVAGGVLGGGLGYSVSKQRKVADARARYLSYGVDVHGDIETMDAAVLAARASQKCYDQEFARLVAGLKAGRISKKEGYARYTEIQSGSREVASILDEMSTKLAKRGQDYQKALTVEAKQAGATVEEVEQAARVQRQSEAADLKQAAADASTRTAGAVLRRGDAGPAVQELQRELKAAGFYQGNIDGDYGPKTETAVRAFQEAKGLQADGVMGPSSRKALAAAEKTEPAQPEAESKKVAAVSPALEKRPALVQFGAAKQKFSDKQQEVDETKEEVEARIESRTEMMKTLIGDMEARRSQAQG